MYGIIMLRAVSSCFEPHLFRRLPDLAFGWSMPAVLSSTSSRVDMGYIFLYECSSLCVCSWVGSLVINLESRSAGETMHDMFTAL